MAPATYLIYYLGLACALAMVASAVIAPCLRRCPLAPLYLSLAGSALVALATALALGLWGPRLIAPFAPVAAGLCAAAALGRKGDAQPAPISIVASSVFLLAVFGSLLEYRCAWIESCGECVFYGYGILCVVVLLAAALAADLFLSADGLPAAFGGRVPGRLLASIASGFLLALAAAVFCFIQGGMTYPDRYLVECITLGVAVLAVSSLVESWDLAGWGVRAAAVLSIALPYAAAAFLPAEFADPPYASVFLPFAVAAISVALLWASGRASAGTYVLLAGAAAFSIVLAKSGDGIGRWLDVPSDPLGQGWAPRQVWDALTGWLPGLGVPGPEAYSPYFSNSITGAAFALGSLGLAACLLVLAVLVSSLVSAWRRSGRLLPLATALAVGLSAAVSLLDQTALLGLYGTDMPFLACSRYSNAVLLFLVLMCLSDGGRHPHSPSFAPQHAIPGEVGTSEGLAGATSPGGADRGDHVASKSSGNPKAQSTEWDSLAEIAFRSGCEPCGGQAGPGIEEPVQGGSSNA